MKYFLSLLLSLHVAFGASFVYPNFKQCYNKNLNSIVYFGDTKAIAITKHYAISYSKKKPISKYIKYDPFLNLYLFYSPKELNPVKLRNINKLSLGEWLASISDNSIYIGNFSKRGSGIDSLFEQNSKVEPNSMITCLCCEVYGIGVGNGKFIPTNLLENFLHSREIFYGDIGARFRKKGKNIVVAFANPFYPDYRLKVGDIIKTINNKKIKSINDLEKSITLGSKNKILELGFLRKNVLHKEKLKIYARFGGWELSDTFLENRGMFFDKNLKINQIKQNSFAFKSGLKAGDKLLQVNGKNVKNDNDVKKILSTYDKKDLNLLFDRKGFQFFVKVIL